MQFIKSVSVTCLAALFTLTTSLTYAKSVATSAEAHAPTPLNKMQWSYDTDPYGSEAIINHKLIRHGGIWIQFNRVARIDEQRNSWTHLIYKIPTSTLSDIEKISLTYHSEHALLIKLPQREYSKSGDNSLAYYQVELPASKQWVTKEVSLVDFKRPEWTPKSSVDLGVQKADIKRLYIAPSLSDETGGQAIIQIRAIELLP